MLALIGFLIFSLTGDVEAACGKTGNYESWVNAQAICSSGGGRLLVVKNETDNLRVARLWKLFYGHAGKLILGASVNLDKDYWTWLDGTPLTYTNWAPGYPTRTSSTSCLIMRHDTKQWYNEHHRDCQNSKNTWFCQNPNGNSRCPEATVPSGDECYSIAPTSSWLDARHHCPIVGSRLPVITSAEQNAAFLKMVQQNCASGEGVWIGLSRLLSTSWKWVDGSSADYTNWANGYPSGDPTAACAYLQISDGKWFNDGCTKGYDTMCYVHL